MQIFQQLRQIFCFSQTKSPMFEQNINPGNLKCLLSYL